MDSSHVVTRDLHLLWVLLGSELENSARFIGQSSAPSSLSLREDTSATPSSVTVSPRIRDAKRSALIPKPRVDSLKCVSPKTRSLFRTIRDARRKTITIFLTEFSFF